MNLSKRNFYNISSKLRNSAIHHPQFANALREVTDALESSRYASIPENVLLTGHSGTGKTKLLQVIQKSAYVAEKDGYSTQEILSVTVPSNPTVKSLAATILLALGDELFAKGTAEEKTARIYHLAQKKSVKLIALDEMQHFVDQSNLSVQRAIADWLKVLIDNLNVSTVLVGLPRTQHLLELNEQLRRRFRRHIELSPFGLKCADDAELFVTVAKTLMNKSRLHTKHSLESDYDLVKRVYFATNGIIDYLGTLLLGALEQSDVMCADVLSKQCLEAAFTGCIWRNGVGEKNPFNDKFIERQLDGDGMPFNFNPKFN